MMNHIDRFQIVKELGRGGQGVVYLAEDARLERLVAIKTIDRLLSPEQGVRLMDEARTISKMRHPHVVSVYEAGDVDGKPYVVLEFVEGNALDSLMKKDGIIAVHQATSIMIQILDGIAYAHQMGIIHRDLNPANIMIDRNAIARIMDFGLSVMTGTIDEAAGTPRYMSPEHFSREPLTPKTDIFCLGLIFYEMLTGCPAFTGNNNVTLMYRIAHEPVKPLSDYNKAIDADLERIVLKALEKKPEDRYASAQEMKQCLEAYQNPEAQPGHDIKGRDSHGTVDFLMRRMRHKGDIPAFSKHIVEINTKLSSLSAITFSSSGELANIILKDVSLTNKLLRVVNSAHYGNLAGRITTISKAVLLLGFEKLRMIASALLIFEHLQNKDQVGELKEAALACIMSGNIAVNLAEQMHLGRAENAFICGMLYNLGRLLVICYLPEEYDEIKKRRIQKGIDEGKAAISVIGISYNELGMSVSRSWNFPDVITQSMQGPPPGTISKPRTEQDTLNHITSYANELCDCIINSDHDATSQALADIAKRYQKSIPLPEKDILGLLTTAAAKIDQYTEIVNVDRTNSTLIKKLVYYTQQETPDASTAQKKQTAQNGFHNAPHASAGAITREQAHILDNGIQEITDVMKEKYDLSDVIYMILELMYRSMGFNRVLFCLRDAEGARMVARFGLGEKTEEIVKKFQIVIGRSSDIFNIAIAQAKGITIEDASVPNILKILPEWYRKAVAAPAFLVYPMIIKGTCIGMFYADKDKKGVFLTAIQQEYMDTLRNLAIEAITKKNIPI